MSDLSEVSITLTRYREPDWLVCDTLAGLARQTGICGEVILFDQNWSERFCETVEAYSRAHLSFRCEPLAELGIAHARNTFLQATAKDVVLSIDPDAVPEPDWAVQLLKAVNEPGVALAGCRILPRWRGRRPFLTYSRVVLDQYSMLDWGEATKPVERIVSTGYAVRKSVAPDEMYFDTRLGRRDGKLISGEESDFCDRLNAVGAKVVYCGAAIVHHQVLAERTGLGWAMKRLFHAGRGRAIGGGAPRPSQKPGIWDWLLLPVILPPYALGWMQARLGRA